VAEAQKFGPMTIDQVLVLVLVVVAEAVAEAEY
jgi:hypothetical protein